MTSVLATHQNCVRHVFLSAVAFWLGLARRSRSASRTACKPARVTVEPVDSKLERHVRPALSTTCLASCGFVLRAGAPRPST
jgi:hypothetical protein